jgi:hypothetical protein
VRIFKDFNEVKAAVRTEVGVSDWVEVTRNALSSLLRRLLLTLTLAPGIVRDGREGNKEYSKLWGEIVFAT